MPKHRNCGFRSLGRPRIAVSSTAAHSTTEVRLKLRIDWPTDVSAPATWRSRTTNWTWCRRVYFVSGRLGRYRSPQISTKQTNVASGANYRTTTRRARLQMLVAYSLSRHLHDTWRSRRYGTPSAQCHLVQQTVHVLYIHLYTTQMYNRHVSPTLVYVVYVAVRLYCTSCIYTVYSKAN